MAYPATSQKYGHVVCMAGITESGDLRRIYPVPFNDVVRKNYQKRRWMTYTIREKGDSRKESYKIQPDSVEFGKKIPYPQVRTRVKEHVMTIPELEAAKESDDTSLGFIKPQCTGFNITEHDNTEDHLEGYEEQVTLDGERQIVPDPFPIYARYHFRCGDSCNPTNCTNDPHQIMCEDIEVGNLYRALMEREDDTETAYQKMEQRLYDWMVEERDLYFMMGTHSRWQNWLIISLLYPPKRENTSLGQWV